MQTRPGPALCVVALVAAVSLGAAMAPGAGADDDAGHTARPGTRLVVALTSPAPDGAEHFHGAPVVQAHDDARTLVVMADPEQEAAIRDDPAVHSVHADHQLMTLAIPNDPKFGQQWGPGAIQATDAWDVTTGNDTIRIAVLDTGIDTDHEDRPTSLELGPDYGDDDNNPEDHNGHGTWVAGILAGARNNHRGIAGIADVQIHVIKIFSDSGTGYTSDLDQGITKAVHTGAHIITMSVGFHEPDALVKGRIEWAAAQGVLLIAAAGNENGGAVLYPAAYPEVVAVSSVDAGLDIAEHSSVGAAIELAAPGVDIKGPWRGGGYSSTSGTSAAAPHVAGVAGLMWSLAPDLEAAEVRAALTATALDRGSPGRDHAYGYGVVQAYDALTAVFDRIPGHAVGDTAPVTLLEGDTVPWHVGGVPVGARDFAWSLDGDDTFDDGSGVVRDWLAPGDGVHQIAVRYDAAEGEGVLRRNVTVTNVAPTIHSFSGGEEAAVHVPLAFDVDASDPADPLTYQFDWDDGTTTLTDAATATHAWTEAGTYTVLVTADDGDGGSATASHVVRIGDDFRFAPGSLQVRHETLLTVGPMPLEHPTRYVVDVDVILETGGPVDDVPIDFVVRQGGYIETFATVHVDAPGPGTHTIPITAALDLTMQNRGTYLVDARLDPARAFAERVEINNIASTTLHHLV